MKYGFQLKSFLILRKGITLNKGKPSESSLNIARNQEFELITSGHFKNEISPKLAWNSQWSLNPSRNLKWKHHCPYVPRIIDPFLKKDYSENPVNLNIGIQF